MIWPLLPSLWPLLSPIILFSIQPETLYVNPVKLHFVCGPSVFYSYPVLIPLANSDSSQRAQCRLNFPLAAIHSAALGTLYLLCTSVYYSQRASVQM